MEKFQPLQKLFDVLALTPDWVYLYLLPALIAGAAVGFVFARKRRWYFCPATALTAVGFMMAYAANKTLSVIYLGLLAVFCALLALLFLIPCPKRREKGVKKSRLDEMYEKFREPLSEQPYAPQKAMPPKECCFEKGESITAEASGMSLDYADTLLNKLHASKLSAGDRLEVQELSARLDYYRGKALYEDERSALNDCLAAILKLTAKYQL